MLTKVLWELHILYFFVCVNVYFLNFSNLFIVEIINFIMWKHVMFKKEKEKQNYSKFIEKLKNTKKGERRTISQILLFLLSLAA